MDNVLRPYSSGGRIGDSEVTLPPIGINLTPSNGPGSTMVTFFKLFGVLLPFVGVVTIGTGAGSLIDWLRVKVGVLGFFGGAVVVLGDLIAFGTTNLPCLAVFGVTGRGSSLRTPLAVRFGGPLEGGRIARFWCPLFSLLGTVWVR